MDTFEAMEKRGSIRQYQPTPVDAAQLDQILAAAHGAPSWANTQTHRYVVVRDSALKDALAGTVPETNRGCAAMRQAPLVIVGCAEKEKAGYKRGEMVTDKGDWAMFDLGIAMEHMVLAATALGLGTLYIGYFDSSAAARIIGVPEGISLYAILVVGHPAEDSPPRKRRPLEEIVFNERYGAA
jgi:nitroreductase